MRIILWTIWLGLSLPIISQPLPLDSSSNSYGSPLPIPLIVTGTFGELRPNHFHSGVDYSVQNSTTMPILSVMEGHVSRIKVSATGYGNALYIDHPNGYTSVYAHLTRFAEPIAKYVRKIQYEEESFEVDIYPDCTKFEFKMGDTLGTSGNSGNSSAPHLHFEIRKTKTERPINPLLIPEFSVSDAMAPKIYKVHLYDPFSDKIYRTIRPGSDEQTKRVGSNHFETMPFIIPNNRVGIGVEAKDFLQRGSFKGGIRSIELYLKDSMIYEYKADEFGFDEWKYINAHIDYPLRQRGIRVHQCWVDEGNLLSMTPMGPKSGIIDLSEVNYTDIKMIVGDAAGNYSTVALRLKGELGIADQSYNAYPDSSFSYVSSKFKFQLPAGSLYRRQNIEIKERLFNGVPSVEITPSTEPWHKNATLEYLGLGHCEKLGIGKLSEKGNVTDLLPFKKHEGQFTVHIGRPGNYILACDTTAPRIEWLGQRNGFARFRITEQESVLSEYRGEVDGKWELMEFDKKSRTLSFKFEQRTNRNYNFAIMASDIFGNVNIIQQTVNY